jgi:hypothetical protein
MCICETKTMSETPEKMHIANKQYYTRINNDVYKTDMCNRVVDI